MTIHKCDICGKEMGVWFKAVLTVEASRPETNVADIIHLQGTTEICKDCYLSQISKGKTDIPASEEG